MIFPAINLHLVRDFLTSHLGLLEANSPQSTPSTNLQWFCQPRVASGKQLTTGATAGVAGTNHSPTAVPFQVCEAHYCDYCPSGLI